MKNMIQAAVAVVAALVLAGGAFAQDDAPILAPVAKRVLSGNIETRGLATFGLPQPVSLATSALKAGAGVITTLPEPDTRIKEGNVVLTVSGRPVFVLQGEMPVYRDITLGLSGKDVLQLEQALARLKFDPGPVDGTYDEQTAAAVSKWYDASKEWKAFGPTAAQLANLRVLEENLAAATKGKLSAAYAAAAAALAVEASRATAEHKNRVAAADNAARTADRNRRQADSRSGTVSLAVQAARAKASAANRAAAADVATRIAERAVIVLDPRQTRSARIAADANLELARANAFDTQLQGELAVEAAERAARLASNQYSLGEAAVRAAKLEGDLAVKLALDTQKIADLDAKFADINATRLAADLEFAKSKVGVQVPADEIVFIPSLPVRVDQVTVLVGDAPKGPVMTVTQPQMAIKSALPLDVAPLVKPGMEVAMDEPTQGIKIKGVVEKVAAAPDARVGGNQVSFTVRVGASAKSLQGLSLRLRLALKTSGEVIAVPLKAVTLAPDGTSRVRVKNAKGELEYVAVKRGLSAEGFVQVTPTKGTLKPGQLVVVGYQKKKN